MAETQSAFAAVHTVGRTTSNRLGLHDVVTTCRNDEENERLQKFIDSKLRHGQQLTAEDTHTKRKS